MVIRPRNLPQADPYFDSVVLLCPLSGEDGDTTATDLSNSSHALTFVGTAALDADIRKYGFTSLLLDGNSDYLSMPDSNDLSFSSGDFTIEAHIRFNGSPATSGHTIVAKWTVITEREWFFGYRTTENLEFVHSVNGTNGIVSISEAWSPSADTWYHVAVCRDGSNLRLFVDGAQLGSTDTTISTDTIINTDSPVYVGSFANDASPFLEFFDGNIENVRITKGVARYTAAFTPPERAYPTVQNVDGTYQLPDTSVITYDSISSSLSAGGYITDFVWNADGTQYIYVDDGNGGIGGGDGSIHYASCSTPYDVTTLSTTDTVIDTNLGRLRGIQWSSDGTQLYVTDFSTGDISSFAASPAYDITSVSTTPDTTTSLLGNSTLLGMHFTDDGKYLIVGTTSSTAWLYPLSTAWDISTIGTGQSANMSASSVNRSDQLIISNDGTRIWQLGSNTEDIHQWTLSTPFDMSTASWDGASKDFALQDSGSYVNVTGMTIHPTNRNELYVTWTLTSYRIQKYTIG